MLSKKIVSITLVLNSLFLVSCVPGSLDYTGDDYQIGDKVSRMSAMVKADGSEQNKIAIFDETSRKIHLFNLDENKLTSTVNVVENNPTDLHSVLYDNQGNYIVDITTAGFAIINKHNQAQINPINMLGKPLSAAFRADLGWLVVYDDASTVGILKLDNQGQILKSWVGGSRLSLLSGVTISSGDLLDNGHLVVSLSDGNIADIDLENTITNNQWTYTLKTTTFPTAKWISRIPGNNSQVFLRMSVDKDTQKIYLFDINTETILDSYEVDGYLEKSSRQSQPHFILTSLNEQMVEFIYPQANAIQKIKVARHNLLGQKTILSTQLSLTQNTLSFVEVSTQMAFFDENLNYNSFRENRVFKKYRLSDMMLTASLPLENKTRIEVSDKYVLALFPNKLGYAKSYDINAKQSYEFKFFNRGYLKD